MKPTGTWATLLLPIQSDDRIGLGRSLPTCPAWRTISLRQCSRSS